MTTSGALARLIRLAQDEGSSDAFLVGGWVRDGLLERPTSEMDLAARDAEGFAARAAEALATRVVDLGGTHALFRLPLPEGHVDIVPLEGDLEADLGRRDFTVNAMAVGLRDLPVANLHRETLRSLVVDPHGGLVDLERRTLRSVRPSAFEDDPVRAWRAARFVAELGFTLDSRTAEGMAGVLPRLRAELPAAERVSAELLRLFSADRSVEGVRVMESTGLLELTFPELAEGYDVQQRAPGNSGHVYDVYRHQLVAFERVDLLLAPTPGVSDRPRERAIWEAFWGAGWSDTRWGPLRSVLDDRRAAIRIATLLHDLGKARTLRVEKDGRTRFFGHSEVGARMAEERLRAWRFPSTFVERVGLLIDQHLRPGQVASPGEVPTERALHRFHQALGDATPDVCLLFLADSLATAPSQVEARWNAYLRHVRRMIEWRPAPPEETRRLADGHDVMRAVGLTPGPDLGRIMAALDEAVAVGEVRTRKEALDLARRLADQDLSTRTRFLD